VGNHLRGHVDPHLQRNLLVAVQELRGDEGHLGVLEEDAQHFEAALQVVLVVGLGGGEQLDESPECLPDVLILVLAAALRDGEVHAAEELQLFL
jgi:hypothetical protein